MYNIFWQCYVLLTNNTISFKHLGPVLFSWKTLNTSLVELKLSSYHRESAKHYLRLKFLCFPLISILFFNETTCICVESFVRVSLHFIKPHVTAGTAHLPLTAVQKIWHAYPIWKCMCLYVHNVTYTMLYHIFAFSLCLQRGLSDVVITFVRSHCLNAI